MASNEPPTKKVKTEETEGSKQDIKRALVDIKACQAEIEKLNERASEEILQIEQKFNKLRKPFFRQRNEHFKKLPNFWGSAFCQHPNLKTIIQKEERDCLSYITDCIAEEFDDIKLGYMIAFHFRENPYFENRVVTKVMHLASSFNARSESSPITWKKGNNLIERYSDKIAKRGNRKRLPPATFFSWFLDNSNPSGDEVSETIKEDLWPSALQYYLSSESGRRNGGVEDEEGLENSDDSMDDYEEEGVGTGTSDVEDEEIGDADSIAVAELEGTLESCSDYSEEEVVEVEDNSDTINLDSSVYEDEDKTKENSIGFMGIESEKKVVEKENLNDTFESGVSEKANGHDELKDKQSEDKDIQNKNRNELKEEKSGIVAESKNQSEFKDKKSVGEVIKMKNGSESLKICKEKEGKT